MLRDLLIIIRKSLDHKLMKINVFADTICGWCFVGHTNLNKALKKFPNIKFDIRHVPFQLNPDIPNEGINREKYLEIKFGGKDNAASMYENMRLKAKESGITGGDPAILVDETFGLDVQQKAKEMGIKFAAPVEKSGQKVFDFEYGDQFGEKINEIGADFVKILVRWNPDDDEETRATQGSRIKELSDWLTENDKKFLLEFLVPATEEQLASVENDQARYDSEIRPMLAVKVVEEMRERGADPDIWKIEGLDTAEDCEKVAAAIKSGDRENVIAVVLGRGATDEKVNEWLRAGSSVEGYKGFAIGRSIFWSALKSFHEGEKSREEAVSEIAESYLGFLSVYQNGS